MGGKVETAIVGAGPYGLSLAAYLGSAGVEHRVFGHPMQSWRDRMPPGMLLKSHPWSSSLYDPGSTFSLKRYCEGLGIPYHDALMPLPVETFVAYGEAFQRRLVSALERKTLTRLEYRNPDFQAVFDDGSETVARRVVLALGAHPFKHVPDALAGLPADRLTHSGDHGPLEAFAGKRVAVIGSGSSATDLAALLHEKGAAVTLIARAQALRFATPPHAHPSLVRRIAQPFRDVFRPGSGIGSGWPLKFYADAPALFHLLPASRRRTIVETTLGPLGHGAMRERVVDRFPILLGRSLQASLSLGDQVELQLRAPNGSRESIFADHVVAATGYRIDMGRLPFLEPRLKSRIAMNDGHPILSLNYETSIPGLHIVGPASVLSFGPVSRFVFGAIHPARTLTRALSRQSGRAVVASGLSGSAAGVR